MIQAIMLISLGFLAASLIGVLIAPSLWSRAYRLSRKRLEKTLPLSLPEIEAAQDQLRASYAVKLRRLETSLATAKQKAATQLVDNSRLQMQIAALKDTISDLDLKLSERRNAATVLEQTIVKRVPELEREISDLSSQLREQSHELQDLTNKLNRKDEALEATQRTAALHQEELTQLRQSLEKNSAGNSSRRLRRPSQWNLDDYRGEYDRLNLDLSRLRQQLAQLQDRDLQQAGVMRSELQKLAELILTSTQSKSGSRSLERAEQATGKRVTGPDVRRDRPLPWPDAVSTASGPALSAAELSSSPASRKTRASAGSLSIAAAEARTASLSGIQRPASSETEVHVSSAAITGEDVAVSKASTPPQPKEASPPKQSPEEERGDPPKAGKNGLLAKLMQEVPEQPPVPEEEVKTGAAADSNASPDANSQKAFSDARELQALSELIAMNPGNTAAKAGSRPSIAEEAKAGQILDLEAVKPAQTAEPEERAAQHNRTLLDRLKGLSEERAEAEK